MTTTINASTSAGLISSADTSGILQLQTANTAALTIDGSQNVGIGTATPTTKLQVVGTGTFTAITATTITEGTSPLVTQADIGSAANEIPLNQYLGKLAYLDGPAGLAPTSSTAAGTTGQLAADATYLYVCIAPNSWKRITLSSF